jgi:hypothetical protein
VKEGKRALPFLKKGAPRGEAKTYAVIEHDGENTRGSDSKKFFGSFFKKERLPFYLLLLSSYPLTHPFIP